MKNKSILHANRTFSMLISENPFILSSLTKFKKASTDIKVKNLINKLNLFTLLGASAKLQKAIFWLRHFCLSLRPSVRSSAWNNSAHALGIFMKLHTHVFFGNLSRKIKFH
jgi:hypothetical protein